MAARDLMANRTLASIVATPALQFTAPGGTVFDLKNQNLYFLQWYPGAIGVKTGLTDAAGFCVIEEAVRGGRHMMAVVLDGSSSYQTAGDLLDEGFAMPVAEEPRTNPVLPRVTEPHKPAPKPVAARAKRYQPGSGRGECAPWGPDGAGAGDRPGRRPGGSHGRLVRTGREEVRDFELRHGRRGGRGPRRRRRPGRGTDDSTPAEGASAPTAPGAAASPERVGASRGRWGGVGAVAGAASNPAGPSPPRRPAGGWTRR